MRGETPEYAAILRAALQSARCAECGAELPAYVRGSPGGMTRAAFCSERHFYAFRDRWRYAADPEAHRERARAYYWRNRETVLAKAAARRGKTRPPERTTCSECGVPLEGRQRTTCGKASCRDRRFRRLHPESYAERERQKVERRRERRHAAKEQCSA